MDFLKKTHHYAAYKRLTSDIRTYTVYIVMEKIRYLMQMENLAVATGLEKASFHSNP